MFYYMTVLKEKETKNVSRKGSDIWCTGCVFSYFDLIKSAGQKAGNVIRSRQHSFNKISTRSLSIQVQHKHDRQQGRLKAEMFNYLLNCIILLHNPFLEIALDTNIRASSAASDRFGLNPLIKFPLLISRLPDPQGAVSVH